MDENTLKSLITRLSFIKTDTKAINNLPIQSKEIKTKIEEVNTKVEVLADLVNKIVMENEKLN